MPDAPTTGMAVGGVDGQGSSGGGQSFLDATIQAAWLELTRASFESEAFATATGIQCRAGCGHCCRAATVEAMVIEMLPLARALLAASGADAAYDAAALRPDGPCVFYRPQSSEDPSLGRCAHYAFRPSVCRLFGFAAINSKDADSPKLATCQWHKRLQPKAVAKAQADIDQGLPVPLFSEVTLRLGMICPGGGLNTRMPINRALMQALEKLALAGQRHEP